MGVIELDIQKYPKSSFQIFDNFMKKHLIRKEETKDGVRYMKGNLQLTWEAVKENATALSRNKKISEEDRVAGQNFLLEYGDFRKRYIDTLIAESASKLGCVRKCQAASVGSVNPTSDYDVTITGPKSNAIVDRANDSFRKQWGVESGIIFDTNLYGASFLIPQQTQNFSYFIKKKLKKPNEITPTDFVFFLNLEDDLKDMRWQRIWAWTKFIFWNSKLPANLTVRQEFLNDNIPDTIFKEDYRLAMKQFSNLATPSELNNLSFMNRKYEQELDELSKVREEFDMADREETMKQKGRELKHQISRSNFFGNETYFTQGAFMHVVGKLQSNFTNLPVKPNEYVDSFIENSSEVLKEFHHFHKDPGADRMISEASKYLIRVADAGVKILDAGLYHNNKRERAIMKNYMQKILEQATEIRKLRSKDLSKLSPQKKIKSIDKFLNILDPSILNKSQSSLAIQKSKAKVSVSDALRRPSPMVFISAFIRRVFIPIMSKIYENGLPFVSNYNPTKQQENRLRSMELQDKSFEKLGDIISLSQKSSKESLSKIGSSERIDRLYQTFGS